MKTQDQSIPVEPSEVASKTLIIGIGNQYRSDDGVGLRIAQQLREKGISNVRIVEETGEGTALMETWKDTDKVILLDATSSKSSPGTVLRWDAHRGHIPKKFFHYSTHAFSVAEAIELARTLNQLPPRLIVYGIEGKNFSAGTRLSSEVLKSVEKVIAQVLKEIKAES